MIVDILGTTLVDYPGIVASTVFIAGCNLRCPFCHNSELVFPELYKNRTELSHKNVLDFIIKRKSFIKGVVFTGGEPLMHKGLSDLSDEIRSLGLKTKLDTNGYMPKMLEKAITHFDYVAMDIKSPPNKYNEATGIEIEFEKIKRSISIILNSDIKYEFRTTLVPNLFQSTSDMIPIGELIKGAELFALQSFSSEKTLSPEYQGISIYTPDITELFANTISPYVKQIIVRT